VEHNAGFGFINKRINVLFILRSDVEAVIIKGQQFGIIVLLEGFGPANDLIQPVVGVKKIVVMSEGILKKPRGFCKLFLIRFFGAQHPVFVLPGLFYIKRNAKLAKGGDGGRTKKNKSRSENDITVWLHVPAQSKSLITEFQIFYYKIRDKFFFPVNRPR
jgi:hypothetical protein